MSRADIHLVVAEFLLAELKHAQACLRAQEPHDGPSNADTPAGEAPAPAKHDLANRYGLHAELTNAVCGALPVERRTRQSVADYLRRMAAEPIARSV